MTMTMQPLWLSFAQVEARRSWSIGCGDRGDLSVGGSEARGQMIFDDFWVTSAVGLWNAGAFKATLWGRSINYEVLKEVHTTQDM